MINIPYPFEGKSTYQDYQTIVKRVKKFEVYSAIGMDTTNNYEMHLIELGTRGKPALLITAGMHGPEWAGTQYSMKLMEDLRDDTFPDKELRNFLLEHFHLLYIPMVNPWGVDNTTPHAITQGRTNPNGIDLNRDFHEFNEVESRNVKKIMDSYDIFAYMDLHMIRAYARDIYLIVGNGQNATNSIRNEWAKSWSAYANQPVQEWQGYSNLQMGLSRRYMRDKPNPYTPHTLSYITEMARPTEERPENGGFNAPLSDEEIHKYGTASIYIFFKTSIEYFLKYNDIDDGSIVPDELQTRPLGSSVIIKDENMNNEVILENAFDIGYEKEANSIWNASFSLPLNDPKVDKVESLQYVEIWDNDEYVGLFRIMPKLTRKNSQADYVTFECEHVLATLLDSSLFKYHQLSNYTTKDVLTYLMDQQNHKHWKLGTVEFTRYFHYAWENENILSALLSVPKPFNEPYVFTFDTQSYPWTLNLVKPSTSVVSRIKEGYNLRTIEVEENPLESFNRIYPLGAGEGVNQLTIESVNNGIPYLEDREPGEEIREIIWPDRRYTNAESLKADAQAMLDNKRVPKVTWGVSAADVSSITGLSIDKLKLGNVVRLDVKGFPTVDLRIMKESKNDIKGNPGDVQLELGNVVEDLGTTNADLARRQQVNELYSQGATNIMNFTYQDNCDKDMPATIPFYVDDDVVNINTIELSFRTQRFRAYSQATKGGGGVAKSTASGGGTTKTTTSGGGVAKSTASGGGTTRTSAAGGDHRHRMFRYIGTPTTGTQTYGRYAAEVGDILLYTDQHRDFYTEGSSGNHTHSTEFPNHTHSFDIPNHNHGITLDPHTHNFEIPAHTHEVEHKIIELSQLPSSVVVKIDGNTVPHTSLTGNRIDLTDYMSKDSSGKITRGRHEVTITPVGGNNGLARIEADLILRVFIQSQLGNAF